MILSLEGQTKEKRRRRGWTPLRLNGKQQSEVLLLGMVWVQWRKVTIRNLVILILALSLASITKSGKVTKPNCPDLLQLMETMFLLYHTRDF